jgi:quercetin dioxygenase-like cupin family protein
VSSTEPADHRDRRARLIVEQESLRQEWRPGVTTQMKASAGLGSETLCVFEQYSKPGTGAPEHTHPQHEEVILVIDGEVDITVDGATHRLVRGAAVIIPAGIAHSFINAGEEFLHTVATFADPAPTVIYTDEPTAKFTIGTTDSAERLRS